MNNTVPRRLSHCGTWSASAGSGTEMHGRCTSVGWRAAVTGGPRLPVGTAQTEEDGEHRVHPTLRSRGRVWMQSARPDEGGERERVVARAGFEPATFHFSGERCYQLSYLAKTEDEQDEDQER